MALVGVRVVSAVSMRLHIDMVGFKNQQGDPMHNHC